VSFKTSGSVSSATFSPALTRDFDQCMSSVTKRWTVPAFAGPSVTFEKKVTLTPE
jgi:hypothetical protein